MKNIVEFASPFPPFPAVSRVRVQVRGATEGTVNALRGERGVVEVAGGAARLADLVGDVVVSIDGGGERVVKAEDLTLLSAEDDLAWFKAEADRNA